jgi:hypothetical protein
VQPKTALRKAPVAHHQELLGCAGACCEPPKSMACLRASLVMDKVGIDAPMAPCLNAFLVPYEQKPGGFVDHGIALLHRIGQLAVCDGIQQVHDRSRLASLPGPPEAVQNQGTQTATSAVLKSITGRTIDNASSTARSASFSSADHSLGPGLHRSCHASGRPQPADPGQAFGLRIAPVPMLFQRYGNQAARSCAGTLGWQLAERNAQGKPGLRSCRDSSQ